MSLRIENLKIAYGDKEVVSSFDMDVENEEFVVLLGPSGSGKTTILRCIAGLLQQREGQIFINGKDVSSLYPSERNIAMVFQNYALYPHLKIYDNISLNLKVKGVPRKEIDRKVHEVAQLLNIDGLLPKYPREVSGGQAQRVGLARAMVRDPEIYLMDEPLSNLDAKFRDEMRYELRKFYETTGKTIVYVTHDQLEVMSMADRVVVLNDGVKLQEGSPKELYDDPDNSFVAGFVGTPPMNLFHVVSGSRGDDMFYLKRGGDSENFSISIDQHPDMDEIILGFRPSDLKLDSSGSIISVLERVEFLGPYLNLHVRIGDTPIAVRVPRENAGTDKLIDAHPGTGIRFTIDVNNLFYFDPSSGGRIRVARKGKRKAMENAGGLANE